MFKYMPMGQWQALGALMIDQQSVTMSAAGERRQELLLASQLALLAGILFLRILVLGQYEVTRWGRLRTET